MTTSILRTADGWWVQTAEGAAKIDTTATTTGELLTTGRPSKPRPTAPTPFRSTASA